MEYLPLQLASISQRHVLRWQALWEHLHNSPPETPTPLSMATVGSAGLQSAASGGPLPAVRAGLPPPGARISPSAGSQSALASAAAGGKAGTAPVGGGTAQVHTFSVSKPRSATAVSPARPPLVQSQRLRRHVAASA